MTKTSTTDGTMVLPIEGRIQVVRGLKVMIDADLAALYGVDTRRLNEQVKRNAGRFPADFMFQLTPAEKAEVIANCDHLAKLKFSKAMPFAFTEHGAVQASSVLASTQAVEMGIYVVRIFVRLRQAASMHEDLAKRLTALEDKVEGLTLSHDTFSRSTRLQLRQLFDALRALTTPPDPPKRPIGFVTPEEKKAPKGKARKPEAGPSASPPAQRRQSR
ncbi:ORF6N domain-containing protein [Variovorax sp. J22R133]|uniref:ORF6N domain-containing protein n=1 Tax=Variovorax brevis TaxID=3053503 RepID=UPI00257566F1|nr:ORF6N domain-containing protein [Variovorax sp. J22R133]MDM0115908.1 ORF6N domain-containing protein [Variovorax sp. J22R133]